MKTRLALTFFGSLLSAATVVYADFDMEEDVVEQPTSQSLYPLMTEDLMAEDLDEDLYGDDDSLYADGLLYEFDTYADDELADAEEDRTSSYENNEAPQQRPYLEAKAGYFFFTDHHMNRIYNQGGADVQLSGSYPLYKDFVHIYASVEYLQKSGHSRPLHHKTTLWELPVSLGLRPMFDICDHLKLYFTLGPRYFYVHVHNHSPYVPKKMHAQGVGGFANTGLLFTIGSHFTIDVFGEYSYRMLHFHTHKKGTEGHTVQVGGVTVGGGLGWAF